MVVFFICSILIVFIYLLLIGWTANGWDRTEETRLPSDYKPRHKYTILIPFKDEEECIEECILSLIAQEEGSPESQIIAINDHSTDSGRQQITKYPIEVIDSQKAGKKSALTLGISRATNEYIITVDADCTFHTQWLKLIDQKIQDTAADIVVGPVVIKEESSILSRFQYMDTASTMAVTAAGIYEDKFYLSNGANFVYKKSCFQAVNGFEGNATVASGDDVFLMNKFNTANFKITYCKSRRAAAITKGEGSVTDLFNQRKRWASKSQAYANKNIIGFQGYIFFTALAILITLLVLPLLIGSFAIVTGVFMLFLKMTIDYLYLNKMTRFFKAEKVMKSFVVCSLLYIPYICYMALIAVFPSSVDWKGRKV